MFNRKLISQTLIILAGFVIIFVPEIAYSQVNVLHVIGSKSGTDKDGVFYSLPRTVFQVALKINKIQKIKGPYADYADKYLGITNGVLSNSAEYEIKEIGITTVAEPNPEQFFFVELDDKASKENKAIEMYLSESGILQDAKDLSKPKNSKVTAQQLEPVSTFADILNPSWFERVDTIIRRVSADTSTIEQKVFRKASSEKTIEQKAKDAADYILKLDESKLNLLTGYQEIGYEKASIEYMCDKIDKLKDEYLALFQGLTSTSCIDVSYSFIPKAGESEQTATLCKFSKMKGVNEKSGSGDPVTIVVEAQGMIKAVSEYLKTQNQDEKRSHGFYYCIPDIANVFIKIGGQTKLEAEFAVNQLGIITSVPTGNFSSLRLHSKTGSLKSIILE